MTTIDEEKQELKRDAFKAKAVYQQEPTRDYRLAYIAAHFRLRDYQETAKHASATASENDQTT